MEVLALVDESRTTGGFYTPRFEVKIEGAGLPRDVLRDVKLPDDAVVSAAGELVLHASPPEPAVIPDPCIRCGWCGETCPTRLRPAGVLEAAQNEDVALAERYGVDACIECGICSYVCPSHLPLLEGVRRIRALRYSGQVTSSSIHVK